MSRAPLPHDDRLLELLADRALGELDDREAAELDPMLERLGLDAERDPLLATAACLELSACSSVEAMPEQVRRRLEACGAGWCKAARAASDMSEGAREDGAGGGVVGRIGGEATPSRGADRGGAGVGRIERATVGVAGSAAGGVAGGVGGGVGSRGAGFGRLLPWVAAAAGVALAVTGWMRPTGGGSGTTIIAPPIDRGGLAGGGVAPEAAVDQFVAQAPDLVRASWSDWDGPEVSGVRGEVVWSDAKQRGFMRFAGLPRCKPGERYQLWIIDATRGMEQRISGGVFDGCPEGSAITVPIDPGIAVVEAAAFAITIEGEKGTWNSDMKRRVVIARKDG